MDKNRVENNKKNPGNQPKIKPFGEQGEMAKQTLIKVREQNKLPQGIHME